MNHLFLDALNCRNHSGPPVWLMRQAGRYMPAYRRLRERYSFLEMCHDPELITKVTLLPIESFGMDAAILFSDILVVPEAMGLGLRFQDDVGPIIERPIHSVEDIERIGEPNDDSFAYVENGIKQLKSCLKVPLIGFCGAPFTVASYMVEGKTSRDHKKTKQFLFNHPEAFHRLLKKIADWSLFYLKKQVQAGVDALQIFDSWANALAHNQFCEFSLYYFDYLLKGLANLHIPTILFCKGSSAFAQELVKVKPAGISLDWNCDISQMRKVIPQTIAIQGNLDPHILYAPPHAIEKEVNRILDFMSGDPGFIFNLGHGILPDIPENAVRVLVDSIKKRSLCHVI